MGPSSACEQCGKKLKVFSKRTKCMHCMAAVCRACYAPHVATRHPSAVRTVSETSASTSRERERLAHEQQQQLRSRNTNATTRATIATAYELHSGASSDDDVHFLSPVHSNGGRADDDGLTYDDDNDYEDNDMLLDGIDDIEVVSGEDDDDVIDDIDDDDDDEMDDDVDDGALRDDDDDDDDEDDDRVDAYLRGTAATRRMSVEEEHYQYTELLHMQEVVAAWAKKEADATRQQRITKRDSCYSMTPIPNVRSTREYQERELFVVTYAIALTLVVWSVYTLGYVAYIHARSAIVSLAV